MKEAEDWWCWGLTAGGEKGRKIGAKGHARFSSACGLESKPMTVSLDGKDEERYFKGSSPATLGGGTKSPIIVGHDEMRGKENSERREKEETKRVFRCRSSRGGHDETL